MLASTGVFSVMAAFVKWLGEDYPTGQLVFVRSIFALIPLLPVIQAAGGFSALRTHRPLGHFARSIFGAGGMVGLFTAITLIPLLDAVAIGFAVPLFTTVLAALVLKETVRRFRWAAVTVGFIGVLIIVDARRLGLFDAAMMADRAYLIGVIAALSGAISVSAAMIAMRRLTDTEPNFRIVFYFTVTCTLIGAASLPFDAVMPTALDAAAMVMVGLLGAGAQALLTASYQYAQASTIATFDYARLVWATLIGFFIFGELPAANVFAGSAVVIASGLLIIYRERRLGIAARGALEDGG